MNFSKKQNKAKRQWSSILLKQKCKCIVLMSFFRNVIRVKNAIKKNFQMFFRSCLNTWYYDYNMNFSKCLKQSRVINSLTLHLGVSQMQNRLSDAAKTNPSPEGGPLNFGPRFERKKIVADESSTILMKSILLMYPNGYSQMPFFTI